MNTGEYLVAGMLTVLFVFGVASFILAPIITRKHYRTLGFVDHGKSPLDSPADSDILEPLATSQLYGGEYKGYIVEQCKAYPKRRRHFTLSKVMRKHNQSRWSVTRLTSKEALPPFCLLPTSEPQTAFIMLGESGVDLEHDSDFQNRYFLRTEVPDSVLPLFTGEIRDFLMEKELISVECVSDTVLIKRSWPEDNIQSRLLGDIKRAVEITAQLSKIYQSEEATPKG